MQSADRWPELFGFCIWGQGPTYVISVEKGSIADEAGLTPGDQLLEVEGKNVCNLSCEEIKNLALTFVNTPPTVGVVSRNQSIEISYNRQLGYGFTVFGERPLLVDCVNPHGPAYQAGLREGDVLLQLNGYNVNAASVVESLLLSSTSKLTLGILACSSHDSFGMNSNKSDNGYNLHANKAKELFDKMNSILGNDFDLKMAVVTLMKNYAETRDIEAFARQLSTLLSSSTVHLKLLHDLRAFIPEKHALLFDSLLISNREQSLASTGLTDSRSTFYSDTLRNGNYERSKNKRIVQVDRSKGTFGFVLRGNGPVCIDSVDFSGSAAIAGLRAGDCILKVNGLDVSRYGHQHLVQLLQSSGSFPTLEVCSGRTSSNSSFEDFLQPSPSFSEVSNNSTTSTEWTTSHGLEHLKNFKECVHRNLTMAEKKRLKDSLEYYKDTKDVERLAIEVVSILDTTGKQTLWPFLLQHLPENHQTYCLNHVPNLKSSLHTSSLNPSAKGFDIIGDNSVLRSPPIEMRNLQQPLDHLGSFKKQLEYLLSSQERSKLKKLLQVYSSQRDYKRLIQDTEKILDTPSKRSLWVYIIPLLSIQHQHLARIQLNIPPSVGVSGIGNLSRPLSVPDEHELGRVGQNHVAPRAANDGGRSNFEDDFRIIGEAASILRKKSFQRSKMVSSSSDDEYASARLRNLASVTLLPHDMKSSALKSGEKLSPEACSTVSAAPKHEDDSALRAQESFDARAFRALKALDDAVDHHHHQHLPSHSSQPPPTMLPNSVPPAPPTPPVPPAPPPPLPSSSNIKSNGAAMNVRRLNWEKLDVRNIEETIWGQLKSVDALDNINVLNMEERFCTKKPKYTPSFIEQKRNEKKKSVSIMGEKKAYNIAILLGHLKVSIVDMKAALYRMDESIYTPELLTQMLQFAPNTNEVEMYDNYNGPVSKLSKPDQFGYEMTRVPGYEQRLKAMLFKSNFSEKVSEIRTTLDTVRRASLELCGSSKLAKILEYILIMGNLLNKGNDRIGQAIAIKISSLSRLDITRTADGKSNFLNVLADTINKQSPECIPLREDLPTVSEAAKAEKFASSTAMNEEVQELRHVLQESVNTLQELISLQDPKAFSCLENWDITEIVERLRQLKEEGRIKDMFHEKMTKFLIDANDEIQTLFSQQNDVERVFHNMLKYFGENPKHVSTEEVFGTFSAFLLNFEKAHYHNVLYKKAV